MSSLSILIASSGRLTLARTLESIAGQLHVCDELLVDINGDGCWGHPTRNKLMTRADGNWLAFMDDDDVYAPGAFEAIRAHVGEARPHIFRMRYPDGRMLWGLPSVAIGNVSTQMIVVPNIPAQLGRWGDRYCGDFDFIASTVERMGEPVWHNDVIALVRPQ